jgi:tripartite ATP-independent transporter DctM subunit
MVSSAFYFKISSPVLIALPLFILMGYLASTGGISQDIYNTLRMWLGRFKSGLGISTVLACTIFGTVCGSSLVTAAVFAKISAPEMRRHGYEKKLAYSICCSSGSIGMLIPPSILAIVYGMLSGVSIGQVLMAGIAPGILLTIGFSSLIVLIGKVNPSSMDVHEIPSVTWRQRIISLKGCWSVAIVALAIFGGMYGGVFSPSEAAAVAAFTLIVVYLIISLPSKGSRKSLKEMLPTLYDTAITSAMIFLIFGGATVFSNFIVLSGITTKLSDIFVGSTLPNYAIVIIFNIVILILGCFVDAIANVCITVPVFNPIINAAGIDPIWYATVTILAVEVGLITPPVGMNLFATKGVAESDVSLEDIISGCFPFFIVMLIALIVLHLFPPISTFLPSFVK